MTYNTKIFISFRQADPAGIMFFGNILDIAHDLFEEFIQQTDLSWKYWFEAKDWGCPIRNCQIDYVSPMKPGEYYHVKIGVSRIGDSSFTMQYQFMNGTQLTAQLSMVHTFINPKSFTKMTMPEKVKITLTKYKIAQEG